MRKQKRRILEAEFHAVLALHGLASVAVITAGVGGLVFVNRLAKLIQEVREILPKAGEAVQESLT
jgi:hypothetical protein